jgi:hypothetical protein
LKRVFTIDAIARFSAQKMTRATEVDLLSSIYPADKRMAPEAAADEGLAQLAQQEDRVTAATKQLGANLDDVFLGAADKAKALTEQLGEAETLFNCFGGVNPTAPLQFPEEHHFGGYITRMAGGGVVPPFGTPGRDSVRAYLTPGEFVIHQGPAQQFGGLLRAINSGDLSSVSNSTTTIGDVHVHLPAGTTLQQVREFGNQLRRAIQRGEIRSLG